MSITLMMLAASLVAADSGEESVLTTARLQTSDKALLDFFRKRTQPAPPRGVLEQLTKMLASADAAEADTARRELINLGACVAPVVREAANRIDDVRAATRAKQVLELIEGPGADKLPIQAARLLVERQPAGTVEVLLDYLSFADNDNVFEEVESALVAVGFRGGKPDPAIVAALKDRRAVCRGAAARVLCQAGGAAYFKVVRPLLGDAEPAIRLRAAQTLADADDTQTIPVLIDLLADAPLPVQAGAERHLTQLAGEWAVSGPRRDDPVSRQLCRTIWAAWWKSMTGEKLLKAFQSRTLTDEELEKAQALLGKLEDEKSEARESAARELATIGSRAAPLLRRAVNEDHPLRSPAAARCLESIESGSALPPLPDAAFRLLRLRRPEGTVAALLAFLPCAEDEERVNRIAEILSRGRMVDGKADDVLVQALQDRIGIRRAVAAVALRRGRATDVLSSVRKLLADKDIEVRRRVARELASGGDKEAVVVLSGLLADLPSNRAWEVEDFLERLAGDKAPSEITREPVNWKNVARTWRAWWKGDRNKVVMVDSDPMTSRTLRGYTLLVQLQSNTVTELGRDGKPRWTLAGLVQPQDAQVLAGGQRVLLAEQNRVTERDLRGKILWQKEVLQPIGVQRLRNGNTFITCNNQLLEVDRAGKEVQKIAVEGLVSARKLHDGRIVALGGNQAIHFDRTGREAKRVPANTGGGCNEVLDNGHVLASFPGAGEFHEYDAEGKLIHQLAMPGAMNGFRLPNGHTLLLVDGGGSSKCIELDKDWKQVQETTLPAPALRVKRR